MADGKEQDIVAVIQTGGTIDKDYPRAIHGYAFEICEPAITRIFQRVKLAFQVEAKTLCRKDSQEITDQDRQQLVQLCYQLTATKILITHGTDTLIETATYLAKHGSGEKTIVFTGASKPETFKDSDADFNVGVAIGALQCIETSGVYIAMNGCVYPWNGVQRDKTTGQFVKIIL